MLNGSLYVDDICSRSNSVEDAQLNFLSTTAVNILNKASMTLRKFERNSEALRGKRKANNMMLGSEEANKL